MELPILHIFQGEKGGPVKEKLNTVIDIINALGDDVTLSTGLLSSYVFFRNNALNPNAPDIDILLFAYYGWLRWKVAGQIYQYNHSNSGFNITLDEFDGEEGESRIDTIYAITPPTLAQPETGIKVRKGTNAENPIAPGINTATEVLLGYAYVNIGGFSEGTGTGADDAVVVGTGKDGVNGFQAVTGKKYFNNRILFKQGVDIASANNIILPAGRFFRLSDATNELQTINNNGWTGGTDIILEIKPGQAIKHDAEDYGLGNYNGILLACENDFIALQGLLLHLVYDNIEYKWKEINGTTIAAGGGSVETLQYKFDHHTHIVTQAEAEGGDFTFEVPNVIAKNMGIHVYCNQLPLTLNKGYSVDLESETSKEVTILKNNSDETYFAIKTGWPIFVGYYYKVAVPGTPENPPEPLSMVTLDSVTHQSPDDPEDEYNAANDVKFILHFSNTGSAPESLNLRLQLVMSGTGGIIAEQDITHAVPAGGNTYEITYKALGITTGSQEYTLYVSGDRTGNNAVTVPAKTGTITLDLTAASRQTTTTVACSVDFWNITSIFATKTAYVQLDSGTKIAITQSLGGFNHNIRFHTFADVVDANAHTVTLYDSNGTTVLDTWDISSLASDTIIDGSEVDAKELAYRLDGVFAYSASDWHAAHIEPGVDIGTTGGTLLTALLYRVPLRITILPNISSITSVKLHLTIQGAIAPPAGTDPDTRILNIQVHESNKDYRYIQNYNDLYNGFVNNDIITNKQLIQAADSEYGVKTLILTLNGNYFENISDGYKGLLVKFNSTIEAIVPSANGYGCTLFQMLLKKIEIIP